MSIALPLQPSRLWQRHWRETLALTALASAAAMAVASTGNLPLTGLIGDSAPQADVSADAPPAPLAMDVQNVAPDQAAAINATIPIKGDAMAAPAFTFGKASAADRDKALECLTQAIYYESATEPEDGQRAVAQVVLNRVRHPAFPNSVCGVVYQGSTRPTGCQFTFTCDGSLSRAPMESLWNRARRIAGEALNGAVYAPVGHATHYHANYVVPYWAASQVKTSVVGAHIFYRWPGAWGTAAAFVQRWSGHEANPSALRIAALNAPHVTPSVRSTASTALAQLEAKGVEVKDLGGRVQLRFAPQAREAVEKAIAKPRPATEVEPVSDNLRYALEGASTSADQAFGAKPAN